MLIQTEDNAVARKTRELCQVILAQPHIMSARQQIDAFMGDPKSQDQYQSLVNKGQSLQQKQQSAQPLADEEIAEFQAEREALMANPVAKGFMDAQEAMREVHHSVTKFVSMTLENGRVPTEEDMQEASCGHGCNCH